jgi:hypothetical protein
MRSLAICGFLIFSVISSLAHGQSTCRLLYEGRDSFTKIYREDHPKWIEVLNEKYLSDPNSLTESEKALVEKQSREILVESEKRMRKYEEDIHGLMSFTGRLERNKALLERRSRLLIQVLTRIEYGSDLRISKGLFHIPFLKFENLAWKVENRTANEAEIAHFAKDYSLYVGRLNLLERIAGVTDYIGADVQSRKEDAHFTKEQRETAQRILDGIGVAADAVKYKTGDTPTRRLSLRELQNIYDANPKIQELVAKYERNSERNLTGWLLVKNVLFLETVRKMIYKVLPPGLREPVSSFYGFSYNNYVLEKYLPMIEIVMHMNVEAPRGFAKARSMQLESVYVDRVEPPVDPAQERYNLLKHLSAQSNQIEMLTTFARLTSGARVWMEIRAHAETLAEQGGVYATFFERMKLAEKIAARPDMNDLSHFIPTPPVEVAGRYIGTGVSLGLAWYLPSIVQGIYELQRLSQF